MGRTEPERALEFGLKTRGVWEGFVTEHKFHPERRWRADFAHPETSLLVECEGGIHVGGRHVRGMGYERDLEKYNAATLLGWRVLRFSTSQINAGEAADTVEAFLRAVSVDRETK